MYGTLFTEIAIAGRGILLLLFFGESVHQANIIRRELRLINRSEGGSRGQDHLLSRVKYLTIKMHYFIEKHRRGANEVN